MTSDRRWTHALWPWLAPIRAFVSRRVRVAALVQRVLDRCPALYDAVLESARGDSRRRYTEWIAEFDTIDDVDLAAMSEEQSRFGLPPLLSIVVSVTDGNEGIRDTFEGSLRRQVYDQWEISFVRASSPDEWNAALRSAAGDFIVVIDSGVSLRPHALFLFARTIKRFPGTLLIYGDEDEIDERGYRSRHYFKPEWNEALFRSQNYLGGVVCLKGSRALEVGGCQEELDGDCAWGLLLRMTANAPPSSIQHLPFVIAHRRSQIRSSSNEAERRKAGARAVEKRLAGIGESAHVEPVGEVSYRALYRLSEELPTVSVVVPSTCKPEVLGPCVDGLLNRTAYAPLEIVVVANRVSERDSHIHESLGRIAGWPRVRVLFYDQGPYNFSKLNNWASGQTRGELLCFLNDDTNVIRSDWLRAMVGQVLQRRVGAVGAMLLYPNGRIQHAGCVLGAGGVAAHAYKGNRKTIRGYHDRALVDQDVSAVTAACMLVKRDAFVAVGGFDERLAIAYNDIDLCLRLRLEGWRIVWTPSAKLYHREGVSLDRHYAGETRDEWTAGSALVRCRWSEQLASDPDYNPNLSLDALHLWEPAFPPRVSYPWRDARRDHSVRPVGRYAVG